MAAEERGGGDLRQRPALHLALQAGGAVEDDVGAALGVPEQDPEAARPQLVGGGVEVVFDSLERRLQQQPARPLGPWAIVSSSSWLSRPASRWSSSPPCAHLEADPGVAQSEANLTDQVR